MSDLFGFEPEAPARPQGQGMGGHHAVTAGTTTWLTPPAVIKALGGWESFDLDPCAFPGWQTARNLSSWPVDGLSIDWGPPSARIWVNPPYTSGEIGRWLRRLANHGRGTALIFARTETQDFARQVWDRASGLLFLEGRLTFCLPDGRPASGSAGAPSVLCAYGQDDLDLLAAADLPGHLVPLRFARFVIAAAVPSSWREVVLAVVRQHRGPVALADLYRALAKHPKTRANPNWQAKVRQTLQQGPFRPVRRGLWESAA